MKAWVAVVVLLVAVGMVVAAIFLFPSAKPTAKPTSAKPTKTVTQSPAAVVVSYLEALEKKNYQTAYDCLSGESKQKHPYDEFVSLNETKGMTAYDLATAKEEQREGQEAAVAVQLKEDVATAGFSLVKEGENWKVVFIGGIPSYPYP